MTAPAETRTRTEWAVRYPDGHREALYSDDGQQPCLPDHAWNRGGRLVRREIGDWGGGSGVIPKPTDRIFRYQLAITDRPVVPLPIGAHWSRLDAASARRASGPSTSGRSSTRPLRPRSGEFRVVGTGNPIPDECYRFLGTVITHGGALVWHVFDTMPDTSKGLWP